MADAEHPKPCKSGVGALVLRQTGHEVQAVADFEVTYRLQTQPQTVATAETVGWAITLDRGNPPADLTVSGSVEA
jgi:hypothetical protein